MVILLHQALQVIIKLVKYILMTICTVNLLRRKLSRLSEEHQAKELWPLYLEGPRQLLLLRSTAMRAQMRTCSLASPQVVVEEEVLDLRSKNGNILITRQVA